jgi:hypothetical protein
MRMTVWAGMSALACASAPLIAQVAPPPSSGRDIVVQGQRTRPSNWREAETQHVIVLSDGPEREVTQIARNLERLYFLMSVLLNRTDRTDDTTKLRVTLIGDAAEFQAMDLRNLRWQQGPFNEAFDIRRYYDPRPDGAVLATTRIDQRIVLQQGVSVAGALQGLQLPGSGGQPGGAGGQVGQSGLFGLQSSADLIRPINEESVPLTAEGMIYAGFAQHYLTTFFPAAYPAGISMALASYSRRWSSAVTQRWNMAARRQGRPPCFIASETSLWRTSSAKLTLHARRTRPVGLRCMHGC